MKKLFAFVAIIATTVFTVNAQGAGGITKNGKFVNYKFPDAITASKTVLFPTATATAPSAWVSDSLNVSCGEFYNYVALPALSATRRVKLSTQSYLTGGANLVLDATSIDTTTQSLIIVQPSGSDTVGVSSAKTLLLYYTGSKWVRVK